MRCPSSRASRSTIGEAQPEALAGACRILLEAMELLEDLAPPLRCDAPSGVDHLEPHPVAAPPAPDDDAPAIRVADRVGDQVLQDARQQHGIAAHHEMRRHHAQSQPLAAACGWNSASSRCSRGRSATSVTLTSMTPASSRETSSRESNISSSAHVESWIFVDQLARLGLVHAIVERTDEQSERVQGLAEIVARRGEEARLGDVRAVGFLLRRAEHLHAFLPALDDLGVTEARQLARCLLGDGREQRDVRRGVDVARALRPEAEEGGDLRSPVQAGHERRTQRRERIAAAVAGGRLQDEHGCGAVLDPCKQRARAVDDGRRPDAAHRGGDEGVAGSRVERQSLGTQQVPGPLGDQRHHGARPAHDARSRSSCCIPRSNA